jgi:endogenous inhibitor of DNA gyrase (YacG/DUF329 family)
VRDFLTAVGGNDPRSQISLPEGENVDYEAKIAEAKRIGRCAECSADLDHRVSPRSAFCSDRCRYRFRDRRRYAQNPETQRERARRYYAENREEVLEKAAAKRGRPRPPERGTCSECGKPLEGRSRVVCSRRCTDARYRRLHPEAYAENERRKVERRREKRAAARSESSS